MNAVPLEKARSRRLDMHALETNLIVPSLRLGGGEVLQTHELSRAAWWAHSHAAPTASGTRDCTHWCMPGIPDVWATILLRLLTPPSWPHQKCKFIEFLEGKKKMFKWHNTSWTRRKSTDAA